MVSHSHSGGTFVVLVSVRASVRAVFAALGAALALRCWRAERERRRGEHDLAALMQQVEERMHLISQQLAELLLMQRHEHPLRSAALGPPLAPPPPLHRPQPPAPRQQAKLQHGAATGARTPKPTPPSDAPPSTHHRGALLTPSTPQAGLDPWAPRLLPPHQPEVTWPSAPAPLPDASQRATQPQLSAPLPAHPLGLLHHQQQGAARPDVEMEPQPTDERRQNGGPAPTQPTSQRAPGRANKRALEQAAAEGDAAAELEGAEVEQGGHDAGGGGVPARPGKAARRR